MPKERKRTQMSHAPCLLVWVLSQCRLKARYRHSSFSPITYIKKERVRATLNFMIIRKPIRSTLLVFSTQWEKETQLRHLIFVLRSAQTFVLLTRLAMSLIYCRDDLLASCLWSELRSFQSSLDFLFNSQLKSNKNSVYVTAWQGN